MSATGRAKRQALYRLLESLPYLRRADDKWADENLLRPLKTVEGVDRNLWEAISRGWILSPDAFALVSVDMVKAVKENWLPAETRARLAVRIVGRILIDLRDSLTLSLPLSDCQQMLRMGGESVRNDVAKSLVEFMQSNIAAPEDTYQRVIRQILQQGWPRDRLLVTSGLAQGLAPLPAATGLSFSLAVSDITPFLVPFDAWSLWNYRLYKPPTDGKRTLAFPRSGEEAQSLLTLLDRTIGEHEDATIPLDVDAALSAIETLHPASRKQSAFLRLKSAIRR